MTAQKGRWSDAEIVDLARFARKRHGAGAAAFAEARAAMFRATGEIDDADRWVAVATEVRSLERGTVVRLRPELPGQGAKDAAPAPRGSQRR